jgi:hypothetical protein
LAWRKELIEIFMKEVFNYHGKIMNFLKVGFLISCFCLLLFIESCAPTVHLDTPEPLKVDITMRLDVYQQEGQLLKKRTISEEEAKAMDRREQRSGEIWALKNDGVAVEGNTGYLEIKLKSGWDAQYVNKLVGEENQDRRLLYEGEARDSQRPIDVIEIEAGKRLREQTYVGHTNQVTTVTVPK